MKDKLTHKENKHFKAEFLATHKALIAREKKYYAELREKLDKVGHDRCKHQIDLFEQVCDDIHNFHDYIKEKYNLTYDWVNKKIVEIKSEDKTFKYQHEQIIFVEDK